MRYRFYTNSTAAWDAMRQAIAAARETIYWESYIFLDDELGREFLELLKSAAARGVRVKLILDSIGSFTLFSSLAGGLNAGGVEVLYFNRLAQWWKPPVLRRRWFFRTHRKLLIVDGRIGFVGGVNVGKRFRAWRDLHLEVRGNIVRGFARSFRKSYRLCGGRDRIVIPPRAPSAVNVAFLDHWPVNGKGVLRRYYKKTCAAATRSIVIATPYFVPHRWLMALLTKAIARDVRVEVILPQFTDSLVVDRANKVFAALGTMAGIRFFFIPEMIHAKALLVDDKEGMVGSNNIDAQSFDYNVEGSVAFSDEHMVGDLRTILEHWKREAIPYTYPHVRRWYHGLVAWIFRVLQPIL